MKSLTNETGLSRLLYEVPLVGGHYFSTETHNYMIGARTGVHQDLIALHQHGKVKQMEDALPDTVFLSDLTIKEKVRWMMGICTLLSQVFLL